MIPIDDSKIYMKAGVQRDIIDYFIYNANNIIIKDLSFSLNERIFLLNSLLIYLLNFFTTSRNRLVPRVRTWRRFDSF